MTLTHTGRINQLIKTVERNSLHRHPKTRPSKVTLNLIGTEQETEGPPGVSCSILLALNTGEVLYLVGTTDLSCKEQFSLDHSDGVYNG